MNTIEFIVLNDEPYMGYVDVLIDGVQLMKLVQDYELTVNPSGKVKESDPKVSNDYYYTIWDINTAFDQTVTDTPLQSRERAVALVCGCGEAGCSSTQVDMSVRDDTVTWSNLRTWITKYEPYPDLGPWVFERSQYESELAKLHARIAADKS
jgi:hypothetical protein